MCVSSCPPAQYSGYAEASDSELAKARMRPTCGPMSDADWSSKSALELIWEGHCPPWVLPSSPVLGRCLPTLALIGKG